jgi:hypothetical protein
MRFWIEGTLAALLCLTATAFADEIVARGLIIGTLSDNTRLTGEWRVTRDGKGAFDASGPGLSCAGEYDGAAQVATLKVTFLCDGGVSGEALVVRSDDRGAGAGAIRLSDGRTGTFTFGSAQGI